MKLSHSLYIYLTSAIAAVASMNGSAETFTHLNIAKSSIFVNETATVSTALTAGVEPPAGIWGAGTAVAVMTVKILTPSSTQQHPAARWTTPFSKQATVTGCAACRDITSEAGGAILPLELSCDGASTDASDVANGVWQYSPTGTELTCTIAASRTATVGAGNYTLSLDAAMRTE